MKAVARTKATIIEYQHIFEAAPFPCVVVKADAPLFTILAANDAYLENTFTSRKELIGRGLLEIFPDSADNRGAKGKTNLQASLMAVIKTNKANKMPVQPYEMKTSRKGTAQKQYWQPLNTPVFDANGALSYIIHSIVNVTEKIELEQREKLEQRLKKEKGKEPNEIGQAQQLATYFSTHLQQIIDTALAGLFTLSPLFDKQGSVIDFRFGMANKMLAAYINLQPDDVMGRLASEAFPGYKTNGLFELYRKVFDTGESLRFDFYYDTDGVDAWFDLLAIKLDNNVLVTFSDYTQLKRLQQKLETSVAELQRTNANLEQFAYIASHDLQEPLRKIKSFSDMLLARYGTLIDEEGLHIITRMQSGVDRMRDLIEDLLTYSRVSSQPDNLVPADLNQLVGEVLSDLETVIREKDATVIIEDLLPVQGDQLQLRQLFQNLLSNALKFSRTGIKPEIFIRSRLMKATEINSLPFTSADSQRVFNVIELIDNGIGFEQEYADYIFQIFQRLHGRTNYPGTGVGLSIVKKVMENHKGFIQARGEPEVGACFTLFFPVASE